MKFEQKSTVNQEEIETNDNETGEGNAALNVIKERIQKVKATKDQIKALQGQIEVWQDSSPADHSDFNRYNSIIETETREALKEIGQLFDSLDSDIVEAAKAKYKEQVEEKKAVGSVDDLVKKIRRSVDNVRREALSGLVPDLREVTRSNDLREKVSIPVDLILDLKRL